MIAIPQEPSEKLLYSMAFRYRHDFGLEKNPESPLSSGTTQAEREMIIGIMRQLYQTIVEHQE